MAKFIRGKKSQPKDPGWMISMVDTMSLMLTFFVMLYAMSEVDNTTRWEQVTESFRETFSIQSIRQEQVKLTKPEEFLARRKKYVGANLDYLGAVIEKQMQKAGLDKKIIISHGDEQLIFSLPSDLLFQPGGATLAVDGNKALAIMGTVLRNFNNRIAVQGHTDPRPMQNNPDFTSNWELSIARAAAIAHELKNIGYKHDIASLGFAATHFNQIPTDLEITKRYTLARRVDIVVYPTIAQQ